MQEHRCHLPRGFCPVASAPCSPVHSSQIANHKRFANAPSPDWHSRRNRVFGPKTVTGRGSGRWLSLILAEP